jgi:hypothetical protein
MNDFDIKKFLTENKMTRNSRLLSERSQIQTNKPLRNLVIQYIKKELPDGKDIEGLFTHEDIAKEYIKKYVTEEEPNYKAVADSDEEMNEWYKTLLYQIQGRESELNEEFDEFSKEEQLSLFPDDKVNLEPFQELLNKGSFDHSDLSDAIKASGIKGSDFEETLNGLGFDVEKESYTETNSGEIADFSVNHPNYTSKMAYVSFFGDEFNRVG